MTDIAGISSDRLRSFVERIERLETEIAALQSDRKDVYLEAQGTGYGQKIIRQIVRLRKQDQEEIDEQETLLTLYRRALGMLPELGEKGWVAPS